MDDQLSNLGDFIYIDNIPVDESDTYIADLKEHTYFTDCITKLHNEFKTEDNTLCSRLARAIFENLNDHPENLTSVLKKKRIPPKLGDKRGGFLTWGGSRLESSGETAFSNKRLIEKYYFKLPGKEVKIFQRTFLKTRKGAPNRATTQGSQAVVIFDVKELSNFESAQTNSTLYVIRKQKIDDTFNELSNLFLTFQLKLKVSELGDQYLKLFDFPENEFLMKAAANNEVKTAYSVSSEHLPNIRAEYSKIITVHAQCQGSFVDLVTGSEVITPDDALNIIWELATGICTMHEQEVIHRDLKLDNVLYYRDESQKMHMKISDFGMAIRVTDHIGPCGSIPYIPLEVYRSLKQYGKNPIAAPKKWDVFSFGLLISEILTKELNPLYELGDPNSERIPIVVAFLSEAATLEAENQSHFLDQHLMNHFDQNIPHAKEWIALIRDMTWIDPAKRIDMPEVLLRLKQMIPQSPQG